MGSKIITLSVVMLLLVILASFTSFKVSAEDKILLQGLEKEEALQLIDQKLEEFKNTESNVGELGPYLAIMAPLMAATYAGISKLKEFKIKQMEISSKFEKEMFEGLKSIIETQRRFIIVSIQSNSEYLDYYRTHYKIPPQLATSAKQKARESFIAQYFKSVRLTSYRKHTIDESLDYIIEQYVTENKKATSERAHKLISENATRCVQSSILHNSMSNPIDEWKKIIIDDAYKRMSSILAEEQILPRYYFTQNYIESELQKILVEHPSTKNTD